MINFGMSDDFISTTLGNKIKATVTNLNTMLSFQSYKFYGFLVENA